MRKIQDLAVVARYRSNPRTEGTPLSDQFVHSEVFPPIEPALTLFGDKDSGSAQDLCFFARAFVATTLPHKRPPTPQFTRECYFYTLSLTAPEEVGLPYGRLPRLALSALTTAALRAKSPSITLERNLPSWAVSLGLASALARIDPPLLCKSDPPAALSLLS